MLAPAALLFGLAVRARRFAYRKGFLRSVSAGIPVVIVGNIVVGGSGKTPLALHVTECLKRAGWSPAILLRGYGGSARSPLPVMSSTDPLVAGDEAVLLAGRGSSPVWVGADRVRAARALRLAHPEVDILVLDDGLQHYRLRRDIEIAVVDGRGFGNGWMFPAGPLREPPSRLESVGAVISHEARIDGYAMQLVCHDVVRLASTEERRPLAGFSGCRVHAVAGIGDPERFFALLRAAGLLVTPHPFADHHPFSPGDIDFGDGLPVMMTEKDAVKLRRFASPECNWWVLPVSAKVDPAFDDWLLAELRDVRTALRPLGMARAHVPGSADTAADPGLEHGRKP
jgi:tetraacyldisaccharide 4'-kinase